MQTVQEVLSSFESLDDMAKALLEEYTGSKASADAEESAQAEAAQHVAASALLGAGAVNPVVSTQEGDEMVLEMQNAQKQHVEGIGEPDALDEDRAGSEPVDPTSLPVSIAEKYDVRTSSGSRRRKGKGSRHKRRRAAADAQPAEAAPSAAAAPVFRGFSSGTEEPTYDESGAKSRGVRKLLQPRSHTMSSS
jgi:hypothetical protein